MARLLIIGYTSTFLSLLAYVVVSKSDRLWTRRWRWLVPAFVLHGVLAGIGASIYAGTPGIIAFIAPIVFLADMLGVAVFGRAGQPGGGHLT